MRNNGFGYRDISKPPFQVPNLAFRLPYPQEQLSFNYQQKEAKMSDFGTDKTPSLLKTKQKINLMNLQVQRSSSFGEFVDSPKLSD